MSAEAKRASDACQEGLRLAAVLFVAITQWNMGLALMLLMVILLGRILKRFGNLQKVVVSESAYWSLKSTVGHIAF